MGNTRNMGETLKKNDKHRRKTPNTSEMMKKNAKHGGNFEKNAKFRANIEEKHKIQDDFWKKF